MSVSAQTRGVSQASIEIALSRRIEELEEKHRRLVAMVRRLSAHIDMRWAQQQSPTRPRPEECLAAEALLQEMRK